jgi:hypothetical protein
MQLLTMTTTTHSFLVILTLSLFSFPTMTSSETPSNVKKVIYLIRHAESEENRRIGSLGKCFGDLRSFRLPSYKDVTSSLGLLNVPAQIDSDVSEIGKVQISAVGDELRRDNFVKEHGIELVAHSPLKRARQTALGMLGCMTPSDKDVNVGRVEESALLTEKTPAEWLPGNIGSLHNRIGDLEEWLRAQPETRIALVGHSQHFKAMLGLKFKFGNCDVWQIEFDAPVKDVTKEVYGVLPREWSGLKRLYTFVRTKKEAETGSDETLSKEYEASRITSDIK